MVRTPGADKAPSSDQNPFSPSTTRTNQGRKRWPPGSILHCPARYGSPKISDLSFHITYYRVVVVDSWSSCRIQYTTSARSSSPIVGASLVLEALEWCSWNQQPGRTGVINSSIHLQRQRTGDKTGDLPGRYSHARFGNPNPSG